MSEQITASGIVVHCEHTAILPLGELRPNPLNPQRHPARQIEVYADVLKRNGWRKPITVSRRSGFIVRGHGACLAAIRLGLTEVPVEYQDYTSEGEENADLLADNRVADYATTDRGVLRTVLEELTQGGVAFATGYSAEDLQELIEHVAPAPEYPIVARLNESYDYVVILATNETDRLFLFNLAGVRTERSYKNQTVGEGRVIPLDRFLQSLRENLHSIPQAGGPDHHAPAA
jgi:hypothetical protein